MELTNEQKHDISVELNASDIYETVPFLNHVLKVLGYVDYMEDDGEREELRWTKRKEPLIKDEKIRKAVRAWAEANGIEACLYDTDNFSFNTDGYCISFNAGFAGKTKIYTIAELCGEEDE